MKFLFGITCLALLLLPQEAIAQNWKDWHQSNPTYPSAAPQAPATKSRVFLDQTFTVPARAEWNREIIATRPGIVNITVSANTPKSIWVVTTDSWNKLQTQPNPQINPDTDILMMVETSEDTYSRDIQIPAGSFMIMMENQSSTPKEFHLRCQGKS